VANVALTAPARCELSSAEGGRRPIATDGGVMADAEHRALAIVTMHTSGECEPAEKSTSAVGGWRGCARRLIGGRVALGRRGRTPAAAWRASSGCSERSSRWAAV
jgi:hypothetical protein